MARNYTKMEHLAEIVKERKAAGETNRAISKQYQICFEMPLLPVFTGKSEGC